MQFAFTTAAEDTSPPELIDIDPEYNANGFPKNLPTRFEFNEPVDDSLTVHVNSEGSLSGVRVVVQGNLVLVYPETNWPEGWVEIALYDVADLLGNRILSPYEPSLTFAASDKSASVHNTNPEWNAVLNSIVFASGWEVDRDIYSINPEGSKLQRLVDTDAMLGNPTVSADGALLAWDSGFAQLDIYVAPYEHPDNAVNVTGSTAIDWNPRFSSTGSRQLFCVNLSNTTSKIFSMAADGSGYGALRPASAEWERDPAPHPLIDNQLLFQGTRDGSYDIFLMSISAIDGTVTTINQTNTLSAQESEPDWGPDASFFVYISDEGGVNNLWLGDLTGFNRRVTNFEHDLSSPSVSPNIGSGECVASLARADGGNDLVIIDLVGGTIKRNLTSPEANN